jgi:hypothetical protein
VNSLWVLYFVIFTAVVLGIQAVYLIFFRLRTAQKSINRRLALSGELSSAVTVLDALRRERGFSNFQNPTLQRFNDWLMQTGLSINRTVLAAAVPVLAAFIFLILGLAIG